MSSPSLSTYAAGANSGRVSRPHLFQVSAVAATLLSTVQSLCARKLVLRNNDSTLDLHVSTVLGGSTVYEVVTPGGAYTIEPGSGGRVWTNEIAVSASDGVGPVTVNVWAWL